MRTSSPEAPAVYPALRASHTIVRLVTLSVTLGLALALLTGAVAQASPVANYGEVLHIGGFDQSAFEEKTPTPGKMLSPKGFAIDTHDSTGGTQETAIYVLDRTDRTTAESTTNWRIQKLNENGEVLASTNFTLENNETTGTAVEGLAVDHASGRLYALVVGEDPIKEEVAAQELIAWSITPNGSKLEPASGLPADPLGTGAGLVASKTQLQPAGKLLYDPQGIAVDPDSGVSGDHPVAIEASDLRYFLGTSEDCHSSVRGDAIVQQVATSSGGSVKTGELLGSWSSQSISSQLGEVTCGPAGISLDPEGSLLVLLNSEKNPGYVVRLSADLKTPTVLDKPASLPSSQDFDEWSFSEIVSPFASATVKGLKISKGESTGAQIVQLSSSTSSTTGGPFASMFAAKSYEEDPQLGSKHLFNFFAGARQDETLAGGKYFEANMGVRLLEPGTNGEISDPTGGTIADTLGNSTTSGTCAFSAGHRLEFAAGNDGALWVLVDGPQIGEMSPSGSYSPPESMTGRQIVELEPGAGQACPQPAGTFTMEPVGAKAPQAGDTTLSVPVGTIVSFNAGTLETKDGVPFSYAWQLNSSDPTHGSPVDSISPPEFGVPSPTVEYKYTTPGEYKVKLTLTSDYGSYTTTEGTIKVESAGVEKEKSKEPSKEVSKEQPKEAPKEQPKEALKEQPKVGPPVDNSPTHVSPHASQSSNGAVTVNITCAATKVSCSGQIVIETATAVAAKKQRKHKLVLGKASFSLTGGKSETLSIHLSGAGQQLVNKLKHVRAEIVVTARDSFGDAGTQNLNLTLSPPRKSKASHKHK